MILSALTDYDTGYTLDETAARLNKKTKRAVSPSTIAAWLQEYRQHCTYRRLRAKARARFPATQTIRSIKLYHRQVYAFAYHRPKLEFLRAGILDDKRAGSAASTARFAPVADFLESIPTACPHELFTRDEDPKARASQARPEFAAVSHAIVNRKENAATETAALIIPAVGNNKLRHETLQRFMLANDSVTLAVEIPIWLTESDIDAIEQQYAIELAPKTGAPRTITGHLDFLQVRNGAVHILDYKPDAQTNTATIGASIGIALAPSDGDEPNRLLKRPTWRSTVPEGEGKGAFRFFEPEMDARVQARRRLEMDLGAALSNGGLEVHYQPLIDIASGDVCAYEALLRWPHPERGMITETATPMEALEIICRMAVRYGDDQIASVLNRRGYSTGKGKRWNQTRVAAARRNHSIAGQKRALHDPERVSLSEAARICGVSHHTIQRLVEAGLLKREQITPRAPWEVSRRDLDAEPIRSVIERLHRTGKLILQGGARETSLRCSLKIKEMIMPGILSEGSGCAPSPRCGGRRGCRCGRRGAWGRL
jgi:hypothetical protein